MAYNVDNIDEIAHISGSETNERKVGYRNRSVSKE